MEPDESNLKHSYLKGRPTRKAEVLSACFSETDRYNRRLLDGTLERPSTDGANEAITNWQKDRGNYARNFPCLFLRKKYGFA